MVLVQRRHSSYLDVPSQEVSRDEAVHLVLWRQSQRVDCSDGDKNVFEKQHGSAQFNQVTSVTSASATQRQLQTDGMRNVHLSFQL